MWRRASLGFQRRWRSGKTTRSEWPASYKKTVEEWLVRSDGSPSAASAASAADSQRVEPDVEANEEDMVRRLPVRLLSTATQTHALAQRILESDQHSIAVDCGGEKMGRFGKLALVQLATKDEMFLIDVEMGGEDIVQPLKPVLMNVGLVKVFHDCREAASLLLNQYHIPIYSVYDLQVAFTAWLEREGLEIYQAGLAEIMRTFSLSAYRLHRWDWLERSEIPSPKWHERPLQPQVIRKAVQNVAHLLPLQSTLNKELGDPSGTLIQRRSMHYLEYANMNSKELPSETASLRSGVKVKAMLVSKKPGAAYFKLNHSVTGAVLEDEDLKEFVDLKPGDVADCQVKSVSPCQSFAHLQREGHGNLWFDRHQSRMMKLPSQEQMDEARSRRQSSLYGHQGAPGRPNLQEDRRSFREQKPTVVHKLGKRGAVKVKKAGFTPPAPRQRYAG